jgi:hypothetical protein
MKNTIALASLVFVLFCSCSTKNDPFIISNTNIGLLNDSTKVEELKTIYSNDSIIKFDPSNPSSIPTADINILNKNGDELLVLTPKRVLDSTSTIGSVKISDPNFKTSKGIGTSSNFKSLVDTYDIKKINNLLRSVVVSVKGLNVDFIIDKKDLPAELRFDMSLNIEASQIPDDAKIKYIMLYWL